MKQNNPPPKWMAVAVNETAFFNPKIRSDARQIDAIYIFDANARTFLCEARPSYAMWLVDYVPERLPDGEARREALMGMMRDALMSSEPLSYMHCSYVDTLGKESLDIDIDGWEGDPQRLLDVARESYHANPIW